MEETEVYRLACNLANEVYALVRGWDVLAQRTIGTQLVQSIDSVGANLVEGDGRSSDPDSVRFFRYARGSARETRHWLRQAAQRDLIPSELSDAWILQVESIGRMVNGLIAFRKRAMTPVVREDPCAYDPTPHDPLNLHD